jgi:hypothetical protein
VQGCRQHGTKNACCSPRREHESIDGSDVCRSKVIRHKGRHGTEAPAVTH